MLIKSKSKVTFGDKSREDKKHKTESRDSYISMACCGIGRQQSIKTKGEEDKTQTPQQADRLQEEWQSLIFIRACDTSNIWRGWQRTSGKVWWGHPKSDQHTFYVCEDICFV